MPLWRLLLLQRQKALSFVASQRSMGSYTDRRYLVAVPLARAIVHHQWSCSRSKMSTGKSDSERARRGGAGGGGEEEEEEVEEEQVN